MVILKKKIAAIFLGIVFLGSLLWGVPVSASDKVYEVSVDSLNVKDEAAEDAETVGQLNKGDQVTVFKETHGWAMTYYGGEPAWVAAHYLVPMEEKAAPKKKSNKKSKKSSNHSIEIKEDIVNVRSNASTHDEVVYIANKGETFPLIETENEWHKIKLDDGSTAWVASWVTTESAGEKKTSTSTAKTKKAPKKKEQKKKAPQDVSNISLDGKNIMLDAGHGGKDPGAIAADGSLEKDMTMELTNTIAEKLRAHGATVTLVRSGDKTMSLNERIAFNKLYMTDAYVSVHFNAFTKSGSRGVSTHYYADGKDKQLATSIQSALVKHTGLNDRGVLHDNYFVLRENRDLSVLVELGFISNPDELSVIQSGSYGDNVSNAIVEGLGNYFN